MMKAIQNHAQVKDHTSPNKLLISQIERIIIFSISRVLEDKNFEKELDYKSIILEFFLNENIQHDFNKQTREALNCFSSVDNSFEIVNKTNKPIFIIGNLHHNRLIATRIIIFKYQSELIKFFNRLKKRLPKDLSNSEMRVWFIKKELKSFLKIAKKSGIREHCTNPAK